MKKRFNEIIRKPGFSSVTLFLAIVCLMFSSVTGARSALVYRSEAYTSRIQMYNIGVQLNENGTAVSWRNYSSKSDGTWDQKIPGTLLGNMLKDGEDFVIGKAYPEEISVTNSGTINEYVRVSIRKYWVDEDENKRTEVSPSLIDLHLVNLNSSWILDTKSSTDERTVLYYSKLLNSGETTPALSDVLSIDSMIASKVFTETHVDENGYTVTTTTYAYNGLKFVVEAEVDAVQEHNAEDAIYSAWGVHCDINNNTLSLRGA